MSLFASPNVPEFLQFLRGLKRPLVISGIVQSIRRLCGGWIVYEMGGLAPCSAPPTGFWFFLPVANALAIGNVLLRIGEEKPGRPQEAEDQSQTNANRIEVERLLPPGRQAILVSSQPVNKSQGGANDEEDD